MCAKRALPHTLTDEEFAALRFDEVRCTTCTPLCTKHMHYLYRDTVLWACQEKLRKRFKMNEHAATEPVRLTLPLSRDDLARLRIGDEVRLSGPVYTMRDAGHERALAALHETGELPFGLAGQTLFYAGPTPAAAGRPLGSVGPTTASRMDFATPALMDAGIVACIGKGKRSPEVIEACRRNGAVYFAAVGGIAALLAKSVVESVDVAWADLGTEALRRLELKDFPVFVAVDAHGGDLYRAIERGETV